MRIRLLGTGTPTPSLKRMCSGYVVETGEDVIVFDHGFGALELPEIVAFTYAGNLPSQRVMTKLGMIRDPSGDFHHPGLPQGHRLAPHVLYRSVNPARHPSASRESGNGFPSRT